MVQLPENCCNAEKAGQIIKIHTRVGEKISDSGIADLVQTDQMMAVAEVYQTDIGKVKLGQDALISSQAFGGELRGTVAQIGLQVNRQNVKQLYQVLFDQAGRPEYGAVGDILKKTGKFDTELNSKAVFVKGLFTDGASFAADGNVITSDSTFLQLFPERKPDRIEVGLITLKPDADSETVRSQLVSGLPKDVRVLTPKEFAKVERTYWEAGTGIGFIFGLGTGVGFIVGIVIVY